MAEGRRESIGARGGGVAGGLQVLAITYPPLARVLGVARPDAIDLLVAFGLALVPDVIGQAIKALRRV
jgi:hypothetical protein